MIGHIGLRTLRMILLNTSSLGGLAFPDLALVVTAPLPVLLMTEGE
jgi:hypothetical protein